MPLRSPGRDIRFWRPEDVQIFPCPACGEEVEIWKDEPYQNCRHCARQVMNPRLHLGCSAWCEHAQGCLALLEGRGEILLRKEKGE